MKYLYLIFFLLLPVSLFAQGADTARARVILDSGVAAYKKSDYDKAITYLNEAVAIAQTGRDTLSKKIQIKAYNNIGNVYADRGNNPQALKNYQQALGIAERIGDRTNTAHIYKNIGALYVSWQRFDEALAYYNNAEKVAITLGDNSLIADCYNNEGTVYEQQKQYTKALDLYKRALDYYTKAKQAESIAMAMSNIAIVYKYQKDYAQSLAYNKQALQIATGIGDKWTMAATLNNIGSLYGEMGDVQQSIKFCTESINLARQINAIQIVIAAYESLSDAAAKAGLYAKAYEYLANEAKAKDSFISTESTKQLSELQVKYETEKKQVENEHLRYESSLNALGKSKAEREKMFAIYFAVAVVVFLLLLFLLVYNNRVVKARAREQHLLNKTMFDSEQKERMRIARDLHDSIGQMLSVVRMQLSTLYKKDEVQLAGPVKQIEGLVDKTIQEVRHISHNLIPEELNFGLVNALEDMRGKINATESTAIKLNIDEAVRQHTFNKQFELSIYRIVQEIVGNMLKHAAAKEITIDMQQKGQMVMLDIRDDGKGFDTLAIKNSKGLGWKNIMARVSLMNGEIEIHSEKIKGTQIQILLPQ